MLINAGTLAGLDENPAELNGYGPISARTARRLVAEATGLTGLLMDRNGSVVQVLRRRRVPSELKRWLQARDGTCRFPGCSHSVRGSEIDHTVPWSVGGPTAEANLAHLCRKHHRLKTLGYWHAAQTGAGAIRWTSPAGRTYFTSPQLCLSQPGKEPSPRETESRMPAESESLADCPF